MQPTLPGQARTRETTRNRLTEASIQEALARGTGVYEPGRPREGQARPYVMLADGGGLFLRIGATGSASWVFKYTLAGTARELGLGPYRPGESDSVAVERARALAGEIRAKVKLEKQHPRATRIEAKAAERAELAERRAREEIEAARKVPFRVCAERCIAARAMSPKNSQDWQSTLTTYTYPVFRKPGGEPGDLPASEIDSALVQKVLEPVWRAHKTMPGKLRSRIETVLEWARVMGYREGDNPARWKGQLQHALAKPADIHEAIPHDAMPFDQLADFMGKLRDFHHPDTAMVTRATALEFVILSALRTSEIREARWDEFDIAAKVWTIPRARMKTKKTKNGNKGNAHRVPLSDRMLEILSEMKDKDADLVFPGSKPGKPLAADAMRVLLQVKLGFADYSVHGFRSTFSDWITERTSFNKELGELQMDHIQGNKVERAYRRGDRLEQRRELMEAWATACGGSKW